ncbi:DUF4202 domain-containing protein [Mangrovibacterium diazotrophicum]|uniref:Uncharacterized protein DUF4202 n=1 Tax=Mangrovibacterium diazotrophicum TaxID=1261403 RepID=A0A419VU98_9BACT|nr:DUF4202 domain-containing protein [Mangrovibacterium diazotrophicum]RKD85055.1 uncharacterized protein DUF4202 [Mangrovibacterium diazotrophicum]
MYSSVYPVAVEALKAAHQQDPNLEAEGTPAELLYSQRLADCLQKVYADASEALAISAWCQHLFRWEIARSTYPEGRIGYYQWRNFLGDYQADKAAVILKEAGYADDFISEVRDILKKLNIHRLDEAQKLEDVVCLVFLENYMADFMPGKTDEQLVQIVQKTWGKMSAHGHEIALQLNLSEPVKRIVGMALA